jgi:hypothetical protein
MRSAPPFAADIPRGAPPVLVACGPSPLPEATFAACPVPVRWAAYWFDAGRPPGEAAGAALAALWGGAHAVLPLYGGHAERAIRWGEAVYNPSLSAAALGRVRYLGEPLGAALPPAPHGVAPAALWAALWDGVDRAVAASAARSFGAEFAAYFPRRAALVASVSPPEPPAGRLAVGAPSARGS